LLTYFHNTNKINQIPNKLNFGKECFGNDLTLRIPFNLKQWAGKIPIKSYPNFKESNTMVTCKCGGYKDQS
jgi:hypothetical protein